MIQNFERSCWGNFNDSKFQKKLLEVWNSFAQIFWTVIAFKIWVGRMKVQGGNTCRKEEKGYSCIICSLKLFP